MADQRPTARAAFAKNLKDIRARRGFKGARQFAQALGIDENRYTRYERGEVEPSLSLLVRICELLKASPNDLLEFRPPAQSVNIADPLTATDARCRETGSGGLNNPFPTRTAIVWKIAREIAQAGADRRDHAGEGKPCGALRRASAIFGEIDSGVCAFVAGLAEMPEVAALDEDGQQRIANLIDLLMSQACEP